MSIENEMPFPDNVLGDPGSPMGYVARFQREVMEVEGAPAEFVVPAILGALSAAGARGLEVQSFNGKFSRPNLFIVAEAESGTGKSSIGNMVFRPIKESDTETRCRFTKDVMPNLEAKLRIIDANLKRVEKADPIQEYEIARLMRERCLVESAMRTPRGLVENFTQEALEQVLSEQDGVAALLSTDGRMVVKNLLGRHRSGCMEDDVYLKAWSGDTIVVDRITRKAIPPVPDPCLSMYLAVQPDMFRTIFRSELMESGFVARLLPAGACGGWKTSLSNRSYDPEVLANYSQLLRGAFEFYRPIRQPHQLKMFPDARGTMEAFFREAAEKAVADPSRALLYRRWAEQACRIAVCIQIGFLGERAHELPLQDCCARRAVELMRWFGQQQCELLRDHTERARFELGERLLNLVQQEGGNIPLRTAWKKLGARSGEVRATVAGDDHLELIRLSTGGRPSEIIQMRHATPGV